MQKVSTSSVIALFCFYVNSMDNMTRVVTVDTDQFLHLSSECDAGSDNLVATGYRKMRSSLFTEMTTTDELPNPKSINRFVSVDSSSSITIINDASSTKYDSILLADQKQQVNAWRSSIKIVDLNPSNPPSYSIDKLKESGIKIDIVNQISSNTIEHQKLSTLSRWDSKEGHCFVPTKKNQNPASNVCQITAKVKADDQKSTHSSRSRKRDREDPKVKAVNRKYITWSPHRRSDRSSSTCNKKRNYSSGRKDRTPPYSYDRTRSSVLSVNKQASVYSSRQYYNNHSTRHNRCRSPSFRRQRDNSNCWRTKSFRSRSPIRSVNHIPLPQNRMKTERKSDSTKTLALQKNNNSREQIPCQHTDKNLGKSTTQEAIVQESSLLLVQQPSGVIKKGKELNNSNLVPEKPVVTDKLSSMLKEIVPVANLNDCDKKNLKRKMKCHESKKQDTLDLVSDNCESENLLDEIDVVTVKHLDIDQSQQNQQDIFDITPLNQEIQVTNINPEEFYFPKISILENKTSNSEHSQLSAADCIIHGDEKETDLIVKYTQEFDIVGLGCAAEVALNHDISNVEEINVNTTQNKSCETLQHCISDVSERNISVHISVRDEMSYSSTEMLPVEDTISDCCIVLEPSTSVAYKSVNDDPSSLNSEALNNLSSCTGYEIQEFTANDAKSSKLLGQYEDSVLTLMQDVSQYSALNMPLSYNSKPELDTSVKEITSLPFLSNNDNCDYNVYQKIDLDMSEILVSKTTNTTEMQPVFGLEDSVPIEISSMATIRHSFATNWHSKHHNYFNPQPLETQKRKSYGSRNDDLQTRDKTYIVDKSQIDGSVYQPMSKPDATPDKNQSTDVNKEVYPSCKSLPFVLPCPLISPEKNKNVPTVSQNKKHTVSTSQIYKQKKKFNKPCEKTSPFKNKHNSNFTKVKQPNYDKINSNTSKLPFFYNEALRAKLSQFKIPKISSSNQCHDVPSVKSSSSNDFYVSSNSDICNVPDCAQEREQSNLYEIVTESNLESDSCAVVSSTTNEAHSDTCDTMVLMEQDKNDTNIKSISLKPNKNVNNKVKQTAALAKKSNNAIKIKTNKKSKPIQTEKSNCKKGPLKSYPLSKFQKFIDQLDSKQLSIFNLLAYIHKDNIPEFLLVELCKNIEINFQDLLNLNKKCKVLTVARMKAKKAYNIKVSFQELLQQKLQNDGKEESVITSILSLLQQQLTHTLPYPYLSSIVKITPHILQLWEHAFKNQQILFDNIQNISIMFQFLHSMSACDSLSVLLNYILNLTYKISSNYESNLMLKLICCKFNALNVDVSKSVLDTVISETVSSDLKIHALLLKITILNTNKMYDDVIPLCDQVSSMITSKQNLLNVKYLQAVTLNGLGQVQEALVLLNDVVKDYEVNKTQLVNSLVMIAMICEQEEHIQAAVEVLDAYILNLCEIHGALHPKTLSHYIKRAKLVFKLPGRKAEGLLELWRVQCCQCKVLGEDHTETKNTRAMIALYADSCNN